MGRFNTLSTGGDTLGYICSECGKTSKLPDFCCGKSTVRQGTYLCKTCGNSSTVEQECCGTSMSKM